MLLLEDELEDELLEDELLEEELELEDDENMVTLVRKVEYIAQKVTT